jgi:hypothetical protein
MDFSLQDYFTASCRTVKASIPQITTDKNKTRHTHKNKNKNKTMILSFDLYTLYSSRLSNTTICYE